MDVQLHNESAGIGDGLYQVVLTITVTAKAGDKTMFLVETAQAGILQIRNVPEAACPNILFPYVRETVSDVISRAGFPPVYLAPVNFDAIYLQRLQEAQAQAEPKIEIAH